MCPFNQFILCCFFSIYSTCLSVSHNQLSGHVNNLHSLSFFRLLKYTPQDRHSFWPHPSYPLPLRPQIHSSSSASPSSSCAAHSSLATKNWLTLHWATADPLWPFSPSAAQQLDFASTQTPTQEKQHREAGSVLRGRVRGVDLCCMLEEQRADGGTHAHWLHTALMDKIQYFHTLVLFNTVVYPWL